jgi:hypothetical protein
MHDPLRDLCEISEGRLQKQINKRIGSEEAALNLHSQSALRSFKDLCRGLVCLVGCHHRRNLECFASPILEPFVFLVDRFNPSEWITIQSQKRRVAHRCIKAPTRSMWVSDDRRKSSSGSSFNDFKMRRIVAKF